MPEPHPIPTGPKFKDLTGQSFLDFTVLHYAGKTGKSQSTTWRCRCVCGVEKDVLAFNLGKTPDCGCKKARRFADAIAANRAADPDKKAHNFKDLIRPEPYGRWTVLSYIGRTGRSQNTMWLCRCSCGTEKPVAAGHLTSGRSNNCGCVRKTTFNNKTHGLSRTPEYFIWKAIKDRTGRPKNTEFHNYGGRGIAVCQRWIDSFEDFLADMGPRPSDEHSIERKDNDLGYSPDNCKWATAEEQANNRRDNRLITHNGRTRTLQQWADELGISRKTLSGRLDAGWSEERSLTEEVQDQSAEILTMGDVSKSIADWSKDTGIHRSTIWMRIHEYGWSVERALTSMARAYVKGSSSPSSRESTRE